MIDSVPLIQNANDAQQINASIIAMKKASRELDEKIVKLNSLNSELDKKIALLDSGLNKEIEDRKEAINSLDVAGVGGSGKYISAISETDGKISATVSDLTSVIESGNNQPATSGGVAEALKRQILYDEILNDFNDAWYSTYFDYEGLYLVSANAINGPIVSSYAWFVKTLNKKNSNNSYTLLQTAYNTNADLVYIRKATSTDNLTWTWGTWNKVAMQSDLDSKILVSSVKVGTYTINGGASVSPKIDDYIPATPAGYGRLNTVYVTGQNYAQTSINFVGANVYATITNTYSSALTYDLYTYVMYFKNVGYVN
jgi:hypothetical protein